MFRKLGRALSQKGRSKVRVDVKIVRLQGLPPSVTACRVVWARDAKVQMTRQAAVVEGDVATNAARQLLLLIADHWR